MTRTAPRDGDGGVALQVLLEESRVESYPLPEALLRGYGTGFGLPQPSLYANFVASVDGVVAFGPGHRHAGSEISGHSLGDRFVMGLLRACADAVLIGAATLRATPGHRWTADHVYPRAAHEFAALRERLGRQAGPVLAVVTGDGDVDFDHPGVRGGALIITNEPTARRMAGSLPPGVTVRAATPMGRVPAAAILRTLRAEGHHVVLCEGGPRLIGELLRGGAMDELFLTVSPLLLGRAASAPRMSLIEGMAFVTEDAPHLRLMSVRRHESLLFLRYARPGPAG